MSTNVKTMKVRSDGKTYEKLRMNDGTVYPIANGEVAVHERHAEALESSGELRRVGQAYTFTGQEAHCQGCGFVQFPFLVSNPCPTCGGMSWQNA